MPTAIPDRYAKLTDGPISLAELAKLASGIVDDVMIRLGGLSDADLLTALCLVDEGVAGVRTQVDYALQGRVKTLAFPGPDRPFDPTLRPFKGA